MSVPAVALGKTAVSIRPGSAQGVDEEGTVCVGVGVMVGVAVMVGGMAVVKTCDSVAMATGVGMETAVVVLQAV
ncbi:MAG: hypothetical protein GY943_29175 [Chloroflexi bacterium]|nr:hypothetical protein [Chloroflexota bacterium]